MILATPLDADDWQAISAIATVAGTFVTLLAVIVALFGEQWKQHWMRPRLSISCGNEGKFFCPDDGKSYWTVHIVVVNNGRSSAKNVRCVLQAVRSWDGSAWQMEQSVLPISLPWQINGEQLLPTLPPGASGFVYIGAFTSLILGNHPPRFYLPPRNDSTWLNGPRYQLEMLITSDDDRHYHGYVEMRWKDKGADRENVSSTFTIQETHRLLVGDEDS